MSDEPRNSDVVQYERRAIDDAVDVIMERLRASARNWDGGGPSRKDHHLIASRFVESQDFRNLADSIRPLPPHVETDSEGVSWRLSGGGIEYLRVGETSWFSLPSSLPLQNIRVPALTVERLDLLTRLRAEVSRVDGDGESERIAYTPMTTTRTAGYDAWLAKHDITP